MKKLLLGLAAAAMIAPMSARADSEFSVVLQGGATKYNNNISGGTDTGAAYGGRLGMMPTPQLGLELGYLGSQNNVRATVDSGDNASTLRTNGVYGDVRINILPGALTPYAFGGYGRTWFSGAESAGIGSQSTNTLPLGGGLDWNIGNFKVGGRFQYNYMVDKINVGTTNTGAVAGGVTKSNADFYGVSLDLGASFH